MTEAWLVCVRRFLRQTARRLGPLTALTGVFALAWAPGPLAAGSRAPSASSAAIKSSGIGARGPGPTIPAGAQAVTTLFTANSRTYKTTDGPYTTIFFGHQVNVQEANGTWVPLSEPAIAAAQVRRQRRHPKRTSSTFSVSKDCPLESGSPTTSFCTSTTDYVGYDGTNTDNSLVQFNIKETIPTDSNVLNAELGMYLYESSTTNAVAVSAYAVVAKERAWTSSATWNTYDGTHAWTSAGGDFSSTNPVENPSVTKPAGWAHWYPTQIAQEWVDETEPNKTNNGFLLADTTQKHTTNLLDFRSSKASENTPYLTISWQPRGQEDPGFYSMQSFKVDSQATMKVNLASGDLFLNSTDLAVRGLGLPFLAEHNYDSLDNQGGSVNPFYSLPGASVYHDGSVGVGINRYDFQTYILQSNGEFKTPPGMNGATLCKVNGESCKGNPGDGTKAVYALTFNEPGNGPLYSQGNKIDFGENGGVWSIADRYGNALAFNYEGGLKIKDTRGRTFTRHTTEIKGITDTSSWVESGGGTREVKYAYNSDGKLETYTDAEGNKTKYAYDESGNLKEITDPKGNVIKLEYDTSHRIKTVTLPEAELEVEPKAGERKREKKHPVWEYHFYTASEEKGSKCERIETEHLTKKTVVKDPNGHETTFCANALDEVLQAYDAEGHRTEAAFNGLAEVKSTTAAVPGTGEEGNIASTLYTETGEGAGRPECTISGTSEKAPGSCSGASREKGLVTSFAYKDTSNPYLPYSVADPQGNNVFRCYNGATITENKEKHEPGCSGSSGPSGSLQSVHYGKEAESELTFTYNTEAGKNGTLKSSKDANKNETTYEYDSKGNLIKITPPSGSGLEPTKITVDSESRPHVIEDGEKHVETITYDTLDHITEIAYTGTGTHKTVKLEYDLDGNLIKREDSTGTTKYTVNALNEVSKEALPGSLSNEYLYDGANNLMAFIDGGGTTTYFYTESNELKAMAEPGGSCGETPSKCTKFEYDNDHRLKKITYASKTAEKYTLEPTTGRPEAITFEEHTGTAVPNLTYAYKEGKNDTGLIQSVTESSGPKTTYSYNASNELTRATREESGGGSLYVYKLDAVGNRTEQKVNLTGTSEAGAETTYYNLNSGNLLECRQTVEVKEGKCSGSSATELSHYSYDKAGEETAITPKHDETGSTFAYNAAKETKSITPAKEGEQALSYGGTGQDDLVEKGSTKLQNSLLGLTREAASGGTSYFARTPNGLLIDERTPSGSFNPLYDSQGNVIALVNSSGSVERTFRYGPYGENVKSEGKQETPYVFGFKGGYGMPGGNKGNTPVANGLYHFGQRYYDPTTGRWTQEDALSQVASPVAANRFLFAGGDPINAADPSGLGWEKYVSNCVQEGFKKGLEGAGATGTWQGTAIYAGVGCAQGLAYAAVEEGIEEVFSE